MKAGMRRRVVGIEAISRLSGFGALALDGRVKLLLALAVAIMVPALGVVRAGAASDIVTDSFTDRAGLDLEDHSGEQGASWRSHPRYDDGIAITRDGTVYNGTHTRVYVASGRPPSPGYDVEADLIVLANRDHGGILGRIDLASDTYYAAEGSSSQGIWQLRKRVNGEWKLLGYVPADFQPGRTYHLRLELRDGSQKFYVDDALILESDDNDPALREIGRAGIRLSADEYHEGDPTHGWQLDNFRVTTPSGPDEATPENPPAEPVHHDCGSASERMDRAAARHEWNSVF